MNIRKLRQRLTKLKDSLTLDRTFLMDSLVGLFLAGLALIVLLLSQVESSTGKTYFSLAVVKNFLDTNLMGIVSILSTEAAVNKGLLESRGVDTTRLVVVNVVTIEEFRGKALKAVDIYLKSDEENRKPCMFVLDSLGMLSTEKEIRDALDDEQVRDMTKSQLVKGAFRMLAETWSSKYSPYSYKSTYDVIGSYVPTKEMGGGLVSNMPRLRSFISAKKGKG